MRSIIQISAAILLFCTSCKKDSIVATGKTTITFNNTVAGQTFSLNKDFTINSKTYNFTAFRYWVSNVVLTNTSGNQFTVPHAYYLVEQTNAQSVQEGSFTYPATTRTSVQLEGVPAGDYKAISFAIGVDKTHNDNLSLQDGELQQMNNMTNVSWMWHTSYIFSSLEGKISDGATSKDLKVQTGTDDNYVSLSLNLPSTLHVSATGTTDLGLSVDVSKVIDGIDVFTTPVVSATTPGVMTAVATNYKTKVFSVELSK